MTDEVKNQERHPNEQSGLRQTKVELTQPLPGHEDRGWITIQVLNRIKQGMSTPELLKEVVDLLVRWTGFEAVGLRLKEGDDYPYFQTRGMSEEFVRLENSLCPQAHDTASEGTGDGGIALDCACGSVLQGNVDRSQPFITDYGSLWTNSNTQLLNERPELRDAIRGNCVRAGYETSCLVPLRFGDQTFGLFQFEDKRPGLLTEELLSTLESISLNLALSLSQRQYAEELNKEKGTLERRVADRTAELAASEERLKRSQEIAHLGSWELDLVNNRLSWSDEVYRIFGLRPQEFPATYEAFLETVHPDDRAAVDAAYSGSVSEGRDTYEIEHRLIRKLDGEVRIVHEKCEHFRDDSGQIIRSVGMVHDITEHKLAEEKLRESQSRLDLTLKSAHMGVWYWDIIENRRWFDEQVCRLLGLDPAKFTGTAEEFFRVVHPDDYATVKTALARTIEQDEPYETEYRAVWPDRSIHYISARGKMVRDGNGQPVRVNGIIWDITERKQMEQEQSRLFALARQRNAETEAVFEAISDAVLIYDSSMNVQRVNSTFIPTYGFDPVGLNVREVIECTRCRWYDGRPLRFDEQPTRRALHGETVLNQHFLITRPDGVEMALETSSGPLRIGDDINGTVTVWHDITELKQMEKELRKSRDELELRVHERTAELKTYMAKLEESNQALQDFVSIASHDLQEPLRKVSTFGGMLKQKCSPSLGEKGNDYLERVLDANQRMQSLLTALLEYSRLTTRADPFVEVEFTKIVGEVLSDLEVRIQRTGGEVQVGELPLIQADPTQMRQLFQNLIGNALKFNKPGEKPKVQVRSVFNANSVCQIVVEDNGIGFEEQYLEKIFAPFQRLHSRSEYEGTGMGLAICKKIVERHSGSITAKSTPGKGSLFIIDLPARQAG